MRSIPISVTGRASFIANITTLVLHINNAKKSRDRATILSADVAHAVLGSVWRFVNMEVDDKNAILDEVRDNVKGLDMMKPSNNEITKIIHQFYLDVNQLENFTK